MHSSASNLVRKVWISIRILRIPFENFEFAFQCVEFLSNGKKFVSNVVLIVQICSFEWFEFAFECFESLSNSSNSDLNASNPFRMFRIFIRMLWIPFKWFEFPFGYFESLSNVSNFHSNASNPFWMISICIRMLRIPFEWFKFAFTCF